MHGSEIISSLEKDNSGDFADGKPRETTCLDAVGFVPVNPVRYFTLYRQCTFHTFRYV